MIDGGKFRLEDYKYYDTDAGIVDSIDRYPHYIADFHTWKVHIYMCKCNYYCKYIYIYIYTYYTKSTRLTNIYTHIPKIIKIVNRIIGKNITAINL